MSVVPCSATVHPHTPSSRSGSFSRRSLSATETQTYSRGSREVTYASAAVSSPRSAKARRIMAQAGAVADFSPVAAASFSAVLSTVIASPLDVLKTRMQAGQRMPSAWPSSAAAASVNNSASMQAVAHSSTQYRNALDGLIKIARTEGPAQLWRGTDLSLAVCVPAIAVYFPLYEHALQHLQSAGVTAAPTVAGAAARAVTAFAVSPMELIRVRVQGSAAPAGVSYTQQLMSTVRSIHAQGEGQGVAKFRSFWRGMGVTLAKDVPFAAAYWSVLEPLRSTMLPKDAAASTAQVIAANAAAGYGAAAVTAAVTTPLDVAKTRMQTSPARLGMGTAFSQIMSEGGLRALYTGAGPRSARAGCAYAILMSSYEAFKGMGLTGSSSGTSEEL